MERIVLEADKATRYSYVIEFKGHKQLSGRLGTVEILIVTIRLL
jgi:hypothetical protein